jgi:hypothetical protein
MLSSCVECGTTCKTLGDWYVRTHGVLMPMCRFSRDFKSTSFATDENRNTGRRSPLARLCTALLLKADMIALSTYRLGHFRNGDHLFLNVDQPRHWWA